MSPIFRLQILFPSFATEVVAHLNLLHFPSWLMCDENSSDDQCIPFSDVVGYLHSVCVYSYALISSCNLFVVGFWCNTIMDLRYCIKISSVDHPDETSWELYQLLCNDGGNMLVKSHLVVVEFLLFGKSLKLCKQSCRIPIGWKLPFCNAEKYAERYHYEVLCEYPIACHFLAKYVVTRNKRYQ